MSYNQYAKLVQDGLVDNVDAPQIAIDYWGLPQNAKLLEVIKAIRADEMTHRELNHLLADKMADRETQLFTHEEMSEDSLKKLDECRVRELP